MNKYNEKFKKQLLEISEIVNSFKSEAVQVKLVDRLLDTMLDSEGSDTADVSRRINPFKNYNQNSTGETKKMGATKILNQLLSTDFFSTPHSIANIAEYCREHYSAEFKTSELSGILLKLSNEHKLIRERSNESNRFEYVRAS